MRHHFLRVSVFGGRQEHHIARLKKSHRRREPGKLIRISLLLALVAACALDGNLAAQGIPCRYEVAAIIKAPDCPIFGTPVTVATGISPNGRYVVGYWTQCDFDGDEAFVYDMQTAEFFTIPRPSGVSSSGAADANDDGLVAGTYSKTGFGLRGFIYDFKARAYAAELAPVNPNRGWCIVSAINGSGTVCGTRSVGDSVNPQNAFIWSAKDGFTDLGVMNGPNSSATGINDNSVVCGWTGSGTFSANSRAFIWKEGKTTILPPVPDAVSSQANALNNLNIIVGVGRTNPGAPAYGRAFLSDGSTMTPIQHLPGDLGSAALNLNDAGLVIGSSADGSAEPFLWYAGEIVRLQDLIPVESGISLFFSFALNNGGEIVGQATDDTGAVVGYVLRPGFGPVGDLNHDCLTNVSDLLVLIGEWGEELSAADINHDGIVDRVDLLMLLENWT